jgi:amino acid transporter
MGSELVGVTFGEAKNPRKTVPAAIRRTCTFPPLFPRYLKSVLTLFLYHTSTTVFRLLFFYIGSIFVVGLLVKATDPELIASTKASTSAAASPFVLAIQRANISVLPDIINGCILLFVLSAANSDLYIATRTVRCSSSNCSSYDRTDASSSPTALCSRG